MTGLALLRLRGLVVKEFLQIVRDPSSILIAFVMPLLLLIIFGYGVSLDADHVPVAVVAENPTAETGSFIQSLEASPNFSVIRFAHRWRAEAALMAGEVDGMVILRDDFSRRLREPEGAPVQFIVNGTNAGIARIVLGYMQGIWSSWLAQRGHRLGVAVEPLISLEPRIWFNAELRSRNFIVPGLIAIIMTLIGTLLTALVVAREWERGTLETMLVTPVHIGEILLGKLIPYFILGMASMALSVGVAVGVFEVPYRGSVLVLILASAIFLIAALSMGLLISTLAKNQFVAAEAALVTTFLPAFMLSGFIFEIGSMPEPIQYLTYAVAARYFVEILQTIFLVGTIWDVILPNMAALVLFAALFLGITFRKMSQRLD